MLDQPISESRVGDITKRALTQSSILDKIISLISTSKNGGEGVNDLITWK